MPNAQRTVTIERPPSEVFAYFADCENNPQWRTHVKEINRLGPVGPGAKYRQRIAGPGGRAIPADFETTAYDPDRRLAFQVTAGPVRPTITYAFVPTGLGTEVTLTLDAPLSGLKKFFLSAAVHKSMDGEVAALDRAKAVLESQR
jgi:uncharacterized protein YndB with AHSA1/START domain